MTALCQWRSCGGVDSVDLDALRMYLGKQPSSAAARQRWVRRLCAEFKLRSFPGVDVVRSLVNGQDSTDPQISVDGKSMRIQIADPLSV